jgi:hypothetical protein
LTFVGNEIRKKIGDKVRDMIVPDNDEDVGREFMGGVVKIKNNLMISKNNYTSGWPCLHVVSLEHKWIRLMVKNNLPTIESNITLKEMVPSPSLCGSVHGDGDMRFDICSNFTLIFIVQT